MTRIDLVLSQLPAATRAVEADERDTFARAVRRMEGGITTLVWRLLGWTTQAAEVEDVVQEAFLLAWTHRRRLLDERAFGAWLRTIAVRQTRNHVRSRARRARLHTLCGFGPGEEPTDPQVEGDARLRDALARLRHTDREVLVLRYLEGLETAAVATTLHLRRAAVDARLSRARKRLDALLREDDAR